MNDADVTSEVILTLTCPDRVGVVYAVAAFLAERSINIVDSQQFADRSSSRFFMRVQAEVPYGMGIDLLRSAFEPIGANFEMHWELHDAQARPKVLILVSKFGHCLNDLLYRERVGALPAQIVAVASNHRDFAELVESYAIAFHYLPVDAKTKPTQEAELTQLIDDLGVDLVVLARYMQILSPGFAESLAGRAINIHHSFLPSFVGARPYQQAHERGVKVIGATAHYVTPGLDEGPIIEQEVARVDHSRSPDQLAAIGRDLECAALARAVGWHLEHRVMLNGNRTVVFA